MPFPKLDGLIAAPFTPLHADGTLHLEQIPALAKSLILNGVTGAFVCGTTGEGMSLATEERMAVAAAWQTAAKDTALRVIVHVGHNSLPEARALTAHAQSIGAAGVGCMSPFFFRPPGVEELVGFCAEVASAAPALPFYYYHIPSMTGVSLPVADFLRAAKGRIPNLAGVKFTFENLMDFAESLRLDGGAFDLVFGRDEMLLAGLSVGATAAIGSTYNFAAPYFHEIITAFERGELEAAREAQSRANAVIATFIRHGGLPAGKAIMKMIGLDCGPLRLPARTLTDSQAAALQADLTALDFFDTASRAELATGPL